MKSGDRCRGVGEELGANTGGADRTNTMTVGGLFRASGGEEEG